MTKSLKGALLSGLVYPGLGQLSLKHRVRGLLFIALVSASLATLVVQVTRRALALLERAESEGSGIDLVAIVHAAYGSSLALPLVKWAFMGVMAGWLASVVDAALLGRRLDAQERGRAAQGRRNGTGTGR